MVKTKVVNHTATLDFGTAPDWIDIGLDVPLTYFSDKTITIDELFNAEMCVKLYDDVELLESTLIFNDENILLIQFENMVENMELEAGFLCAYTAGAVTVVEGDTETLLEIPKKGLYWVGAWPSDISNATFTMSWQSVETVDWLRELFINEAKAISGKRGGSGGTVSDEDIKEAIDEVVIDLSENGQVGRAERKVYTYTGAGETTKIGEYDYRKLVDKAIDHNTIVNITVNMSGAIVECGKETFTVEASTLAEYPESKAHTVYIPYSGQLVPVVRILDFGSEQSSTLVVDMPMGYVSSIETETICPIDQKYLPNNVIKLNDFPCTIQDGAVTTTIGEFLFYLTMDSFADNGAMQNVKITDLDGKFKKAVSEVADPIFCIEAKGAAAYAHPNIIRDEGRLAQLILSGVLWTPTDEGHEFYIEYTQHMLFSGNTDDITLQVKATLWE